MGAEMSPYKEFSILVFGQRATTVASSIASRLE